MMAIVVGKTELILICLVAVALLALLARKIRVPYPILLTCGGVLLALVPGLPAIQLEPQLVFNLFLPPLLYPAAVFTSWRSEERRVGKECRGGWWRAYDKKKCMVCSGGGARVCAR